jgi:hypothetical protein
MSAKINISMELVAAYFKGIIQAVTCIDRKSIISHSKDN